MSATPAAMVSNNISGDWQVISGVHTRERPPQYTDNNLSAAQAGDTMHEAASSAVYPATLEDSCLDIDEKGMGLEEDANAAKYPPSLHTDHSSSASSAGTITHSVKTSLIDQMDTFLYHFEHPSETMQEHRLTEKALKAHDVDSTSHGYHRDLSGWCRDGTLFIGVVNKNELSDSMVISHHAKSRVTDATNSSWSMFSTQTFLDYTAENITGAGGMFFELATSPQTLEDDIVIV
jgi:hypothetical protein